MKKFRSLLLLLTFLFILTACGDLSNSKKSNDRIEVYDKNQNIIVKKMNQKDLDYFSDLIGKSTDNTTEDDFSLVTLPNDAEIIYEYKFITSREDGKETKVYFDIYDNYPYITLKGIPIISPLTWKLSDEEYLKLKNPKNN